MMIGNAQYQCSCVRYMFQDNIPLIVCLSVALGLLLIIVVFIIIIVLCRRRQRKSTAQNQTFEDNDKTSTKQHNRQNPHSIELTPRTPGQQPPNEKSWHRY